jgi:hypothetical protein
MVSKPWWPSGHDFESYYPYLFDKNQAQGNVDLCKFQVQRTFAWEGVLENNI